MYEIAQNGNTNLMHELHELEKTGNSGNSCFIIRAIKYII